MRTESVSGVSCGIFSYTLIRVLRGRWREVHPLLYVLTLVLLLSYRTR